MSISWKELKPIIASFNNDGGQYLSVLDEEGNILLANSRMLKELNLENPRIGKNNFFDLLHPVHIENFRNAFGYSVKNNSPYSMELFLKNGHYKPMQWHVSFLPDSGNQSKKFICAGYTQTRLESGLKKSIPAAVSGKKLFRSFMNNMPSMIWVVDEEAALVFANDVFLKYFRINEDSLHKKIVDILPLEVVDALYEKHLKVLQTGLPVESMEKNMTAGGEHTIFRVNIFPLDVIDGKKMAGGIASNLTDKYDAEKKLAKATDRLTQITRITSDAIWEWDMLSGDIYRNEKLIEITGYLPKEHAGLAWWLSRVHPEDRDNLNETLKEVTDNGLQSWESQYRFLCADGEYKNMLDRGFVIYEKGMPVKMVGSLSDITNEKLMENLLIEEKLRQYKNISETAMRVQEQERTRLGREMHDNVNQILSTIKMFVGLLTPATEEEKEIKRKTIEYCLMAIEEIRKLSREMVAPQLDGGSLAESISKVTADMELSSVMKVKFTHDNETEILSPGKKLTLFRIVQEQLKNILKYSRAKQVEIFLHSKNGQVQLIVKDDGVGFDMKKTNTGIGLASIRDRAKFYNGKTEINAAPGKGCEVIVSIPLLD